MQKNRYGSSIKNNSNLTNKDIKKYLSISAEASHLLSTATDKLNLSARRYFKILKVSRTIADLEGSETILPSHISEALQYR